MSTEQKAGRYHDLLLQVIADNPEHFALSNTSGEPLVYKDLGRCIGKVSAQLRDMGLQKSHTVAVSMPDCAEALVVILAAMEVASVFPVSYTCTRKELSNLFELLKPDLMITTEALSEPLEMLCDQLVIPRVLYQGTLFDGGLSCGLKPDFQADENRDTSVCLYIATAGTNRSKIVSLTDQSLVDSVSHAADWYGIDLSDRTICMMPFAHLHSLVRSTLPGLIRGAHVTVTPGFDPIRMTGWIDACQPTYFTAVPSMYRALIKRATVTDWRPAHESLKFIVTGSDKMDALTAGLLKDLLGCPCRQFYGLSEASPLVVVADDFEALVEQCVGAVNPTWEVTILDQYDQPVTSGSEGQIVIRGGHINRTIGSEQRMTEYGLVTGDSGYLDDQGRLFLTGRTDNQINRAGKKISSSELESVLLEIPGVLSAAVVGVPDDEYGEKVGAAVVLDSDLEDEIDLSPHDIHFLMSQRLSHDKLPEYIVFVDSLPSSKAGKISRANLLSEIDFKQGDLKTSVTSSEKYEEADLDDQLYHGRHREENMTELIAQKIIHSIFKDIFQNDDISINDNFFDLGGNSIMAVNLLMKLDAVLGSELNATAIFQAPTPEKLARLIVDEKWNFKDFPVLPMQPVGDKPPLFAFPGVWGVRLMLCYLATKLKRHDCPLYVLQYTDADSIEEIAQGCVHHLLKSHPNEQTYHLLPISFGCFVAMETARLLNEKGKKVRLILLDPPQILERQDADKLYQRAKGQWRMFKSTFIKAVKDGFSPKYLKARIYNNWLCREKYNPSPIPIDTYILMSQKRANWPGHMDKYKSLFNSTDIRVVGEDHAMIIEPNLSLLVDELMDITALQQ